MKNDIKLAYIVTHPIQYQAPMLRYLSEQPGLDLQVFFISDFSVRSYRDTGFGVPVQWDTPLLSGYNYEFLPSLRRGNDVGFLSPLACGLAERLGRGFDVVWLHGYANATLLSALFTARRAGIPVLLRGESTLTSHRRSSMRNHVKEAVMPRLFQQIDAFLSVGAGNTEYYRHYGVDAGKIFNVPYAVDNQYFQDAAVRSRKNRNALRAELGLDSKRPVILFSGKFISRKRPEDLWNAYRRLSKDGVEEPYPYLVFVGDGELRSALESEVRSTAWRSVCFAGFRNQSEMPAFYDLCEFMVVPSEHEPWGLVVNEVMNAARPVIVTEEVGAATDLVRPGETGFICPVGDIDALTSCMRELLENPGTAAAMGEKALARVSEHGFQADWAGLAAALEFVCPR